VTAVEVNLDGLVGPTHNDAGLSEGNLASQRSRARASDPRAAALEGVAKMRRLLDLGVPQGVLPPHGRPDLDALRRLGFAGDDARVLRRAAAEAPHLLAACCSASAMWAANAATVRPAADGPDGRLHLVTANLVSTLHRSLEPPGTARLLRALLPGAVVHDPLPATPALGDEGAANHVRLCAAYGEPGLHVMVVGRDAGGRGPRRFPARQTRAASEAVARLLGIPPERLLILRQHPDAIDAGAFHNDVVCVGDRDVLLVHERAFAGGVDDVARIDEALRRVCGVPLRALVVPEAAVPLDDAVSSYLFNSQIVRAGDGRTVLVAPAEAAETPSTAAWLDAHVGRAAPVEAVEVVDVRGSMRNGGGPACLRLRVVLDAGDLPGLPRATRADHALLDALEAWVRRHHRDRLTPADLADPALVEESRAALADLSGLLGLREVDSSGR
jgi:succinylarginine dihydrolase